MTFSRRSLLRLAGAAAAGAALPGRARADVLPVSQARLVPARYGDVALRDGPLREQFLAQRAALLAMDEDALLKPFRAAAGMAAPGAALGGWYNASPSFDPPADMHGFIPGHSFGQYVSSLARAFAVTGDEATRQKVRRLVAGFAQTITPRFYDGYTLPAYTFDKINIGLIDAHEFAGDETALAALNRATDAALPSLPEKALTRPEMAARPHPNVAHTWDESYTLPENLYLAWRRGAGERYRALASRFLLDGDYFEPLARGENVLPGRHAYSHVNALSSAMQAYLVDGDPKHLQAAKNGFDFVVAQSFATGGWGPNEGFVVPGSGALGDSLGTTHASFETPCGAYGHFKIARYLMGMTGDSRYGDSMERVLYNTVLGALPMKPDGTAFYYADYNGNGAKTYFEYRCPCCSGTLGQAVADYGISAYFTDDDGIYVNLYAPSRFTWRRGGHAIALGQETAYPLDSDIALTVEAAAAETFSVRLRIPAWAGPRTAIAVNGTRIAAPVRPGRFHAIRRTWRDGDKITLSLDRALRLEAVDDKHPDLLAVMQGPLALFATGDRFLPLKRRDLMAVRQVAAGGPDWRVETADGAQTFKPYFAIGGETTRLYQPVSG
ncbi:MAG: beta-L-arabinofuranosidase domain-containing protein [Rhizomicrobium sp.]